MKHADPPRLGQSLSAMVLFLALLAALSWLLFGALKGAFLANPAFNGLILAVFAVGVLVQWRRLSALRREAHWLPRLRTGELERKGPPPRLLKPLIQLLSGGAEERRAVLSPTTLRAMLDGVASRLEESRELSRYLIGLLVFLGLLGTFWGLLLTIAAVSEVIAGMPAGGESLAWFEQLRASLERPLQGMATAFSTSLFGLAGALALGFLDLVASRGQNRFLAALEDALTGLARLPPGALAEVEGAVPSYLEALIGSLIENLDRMQRLLNDGERLRQEHVEQGRALAAELNRLNQNLRDQSSERERVIAALDALRLALAERAALSAETEAIREELRLIARTLGRALEERRERAGS